MSKKVDGLFDGAATPVKMFDNDKYIYVEKSIVGMQDIRNEALRLSLLSNSLPTDAGWQRAPAHSEFEKQMTRLGLSIVQEAKRRAKVRESYILSLNGEILRLQQKHQESIVGAYRICAMRKKFLENQIESMTKGSQVKPLDPTQDKKYRGYCKELKSLKAHHRILVLREKEIIFRQEFLYRLLDAEKNKIVKAYRSLIAEIRPVGGSFSMTKFSDEEMVKVMNDTVGKHYPSDWIKASNQFSPLAIRQQNPTSDKESGSYYAANRIFCSEDSPLSALSDSVVLGDPNTIAMLYAVMRYSIPEITLNSTVFFCEGDYHQGMVTPDLDFFDPEVHDSNADGTPAGEGWSFNNFPWDELKENEDDEYPFDDVFPLNQWFKRSKYQGENFDTIVVEDFQEDHAYHEFGHRAEHVVKKGIIIFQEQAFLDRRTREEDGTRQLVMFSEEGGVCSPSFDKDSRFDELNASPSTDPKGEGDEGSADDIFQRAVMEQANFITLYMGRIYPSTGNREVLSMGAEMILGGTYGAGCGYDPDYDTPDLDYCGFILGALAVL